MKGKYNFIVRLDLSDNRQARISKYLQTLHEKTSQSINGFVIDAIADHIDYQSYTREQHNEDMRRIFQEEIRRMLISSNPNQTQVIVPLHQPQTKTVDELDQELADDLELFE